MPYIDFKTVKKLCTMEQLLAHYDVKLRAVGGDALKGKCPLPAHGTTKSESFSVSRSKNVWKCFSCDAGGNVLDFVAVMESCALNEAAQKLAEWFGQKEKAPTHMEKGPDAPNGNTPKSHSDSTAPAGNGKPVPYMKLIDSWWGDTFPRGDQEEDENYSKRLLNGIKAKLLESYRSGKLAGQPPAKAA